MIGCIIVYTLLVIFLYFKILIIQNCYIFLFPFNRKDTPAAKIFESMTSEDFKHSIVVTKTTKRLAWLVVIVINIYFVYFSVLRGITRSTSWQVDYLLACILQLFVEILVYETVECLWIHFTIPKLVSEDISATMNTVKHTINSAFSKVKIPAVLDSPKYFFVSRHLAEEYPHLFESSIVLAFQSYFPPSELDTTSAAHDEKEHAVDQSDENQEETNQWGLHHHDIHAVRRKKKKSVLVAFLQRFNFSVLLMATLQHLGTVPIRFQQLIIHTLQPILFSFVIIFYFFLVKYPMVTLFPMAFIVYEAIMYAHRIGNGSTKSIPAINDAVKNTFVADTNARSRRESGMVNAVAHENKDGDDDDSNGVGDEKEDEILPVGRVLEATGGQRGHIDSDGDSDSDGSDSDGYYERNIEKLMLQYAPRRDNLDDESENADSGECDSDVGDKEEEHDNVEVTAAAVVPLSATEARVLELQQEVYAADDAVKHMCVRIGLNIPEDFDFYWKETSDEYQYLYQQPITPFVNSHGESVDRTEIVSRRDNIMIKDEVNMKRNTDLARKGVQRWNRYMLEWDTFRLYHSDLALPFIDHGGILISTREIEAARGMSHQHRGVSSGRNSDIPIVKELHALKKRKQVLEHQLLQLEEPEALQMAGKK